MFAELAAAPGDVSFDGIMRGIVVNNVDPKGEGRVAIVIPKLMPYLDGSEAPTKTGTKTTNPKSLIDNDDENPYDTTIQAVNFFWARPTFALDYAPAEKTVTSDVSEIPSGAEEGTHQTVEIGGQLKETSYVQGTGTYKIPRIESTVFVLFEDGDPQKCYFLPFSPTLYGEVTPMANVESFANRDTMQTKVNIHVLREWQNGNVLYADTNNDRNTFILKFANGHRLKLEFNADSSVVTLNTQSGHQLKLVDKSSAVGDDNPLDANDEDGVNHGTFVKLETSAGHFITMDDNAGYEKIHVRTVKGHYMLMDDVADLVHIYTYSGSLIELNQGTVINIKTGSTVNVESGSQVNVKAGSAVDVQAGATIRQTAGMIYLNS